MTHPQVMDRGDGMKMRRIAVNILNKQWRTASRGWSSTFGVGQGTNNSHGKITNCYCCEIFKRAMELDGFSGRT
jgi:hypothetical protein